MPQDMVTGEEALSPEWFQLDEEELVLNRLSVLRFDKTPGPDRDIEIYSMETGPFGPTCPCRPV